MVRGNVSRETLKNPIVSRETRVDFKKPTCYNNVRYFNE